MTEKSLDTEYYFDYITRRERNAPSLLAPHIHRAGGARGVSFPKEMVISIASPMFTYMEPFGKMPS